MGSVGPRRGCFSMWRTIRPGDGPGDGDLGELKKMAMETGRPHSFGDLPLWSDDGGPSVPNPTYLVRNYAYLIEQRGDPGGLAVLDVGPGLGRNVFPLLDRGMRVAAAEPDERMRAILWRFARKWGVSDRLSVLDSTYQSLRLTDGAYDGLVSTGSAQFLGTGEAACGFFDRARKAMKPGGVLLLEANNSRDEYSRRAASRPGSMFYVPAGDDVLRMAEGGGWEVLNFEPDRQVPWRGAFAGEYNRRYMEAHAGAPEIAFRNKTYLVARNST